MRFPHFFSCLLATILVASSGSAPAAETKSKPVLLYSRYFNAEGEDRYLPDGNYKAFLEKLRSDFEVVVHNKPLTAQTLRGIDVVLIANPSDKAAKDHPAPHHFLPKDISAINAYISRGGGLIIMGNQENHNLEVEDTNNLLKFSGLQFTNVYTDAKQLIIPRETPILGGLRWAYYTGNSVAIENGNKAHPRALVMNDLKQKPLKGPRDAPGALLAIAEPGKGRVAVVTDAGWLTDTALDGTGIGGVAIKEHDNYEIFARLAKWAAHKEN
jgi:hypothetical protein